MPFEALLFAINPDCEVVFFADGYLAGVEDASGAVVEAEEAVAVVVEPAALDENAQVGANLFNLQSCDVFGEVLCVGPDIAHAARSAALLGIGSP